MSAPILRKTKIICTIGPSCWDRKNLYNLADYGMNVARLNFSHGKRAKHQSIIDTITDYNKKHDVNIATMLDTQGAEIRTGDVQEPIAVQKGDEVLFSSTASKYATEGMIVVEVSYDHFAKDVVETDRILVDNGELSFDIVRINDDGSVLGKAKEDGSIGTRRHINLPGADIDLPSVTEKDWGDIEFGASQNLDFIALSFIRTAEEVREVRALLDRLQSTSKIISKIETQKGVENIREIIDVSDGIMVARGDLGSDMPFEDLPIVQDEIVTRCRDAGKPVIIATHMLESMKEHPMPTRAEVTDTSHAVATGADTTMLSGETASGKHPLVALDAMVRIHKSMEEHIARLKQGYEIRFQDSAEEEMDSAVALAEEEEVDAIIVLTDSGRTAQHVSKFRPTAPVIALVPNASIQRSLLLSYGVYPLVVPVHEEDDVTCHDGIVLSQKLELLSKGHKVLILRNRAKEPLVQTIE